MERPPGGDPFQRVIERNGLLIPPDAVEGLHCSTPQWYFSRKEVEELSPSRKDGVSFKKETVLRSLYCSFLQDLGMKLKVPQVTIATAMMLCHRFYLRQSHAKNEWQTVASVCMFLACKVEETPRLLKDVVVVAYETVYKRDFSAAQRIKQKDVYDKQKELIVIGERVLLATVGFDLNIQHPYKPLVAALKKLNITHNDITKVAWNFVNDWLRTTLCLEYKPHYVAAGSLYLAAKFHKVKLPSEKGKVWWLEFDVTPTRLEEVIQQMLTLLEQSKNPLMPFSRDKVTQATVANKAPSASLQSCVLNGPNTGSANRVQEKPGGDDKSQKLSDAHLDNKQSVPNEDVCVARKAEVVGCQNKNPVMPLSGKEVAQAMVAKKAQSGSPHSCVLNGPNSLGDSRKMVDKVTEGDDRSLDVTNDCPQNRKDVLNEDSSIIRKEEISQCQTSDCGSAHSVVEDGNRSDEGEVQEKVVVESNETASCEIASDSGVLNKIEDVNRSKESEVATVVVVSNDTANCIVAADNGLNKIDKDRIREAVKKRKFNRMANKSTVLSTHEDDDSWIVRELENGIEMQYASAEKKQRL